MKTIQMEGIILKHYPLFEKDKCLEIFSPEHGKIKLLAKYAYGKSRFGGRLEQPNKVCFQVHKGKGFYTVTQCDLLEHYPNIRQTLSSISFCLYALDIIRKITPQHHPNPELYEALSQTLSALNSNPTEIEKIQNQFQKSILESEGLYSDKIHIHSNLEFTRIVEQYAERKVNQNTTQF